MEDLKVMTKEVASDILEGIIDANRDKLMDYAKLLGLANSRARLTGPADPKCIFDEHIVDCLAALPLIPPNVRIVDIGTGGGLPGLVWAVCRSDVFIDLLDSVGKKCLVLEEMVRSLNLENVRVHCSRAEEFASSNKGLYDLAAARAVSHLGVLLEYFSPLVRRGGSCMAFKGPKGFEELEEFEGKEEKLGWSGLEIWSYEVAGKELYLFTWKKVKDAQKSVPRRVGIPERRPWWR